MKAKLIVEDKEFEIDINHPELEKLIKPEKKTGYERVGKGQTCWISLVDGSVSHHIEYPGIMNDISNQLYSSANYYSDKTIAENNARADKLMRQLRRFAIEHREEKIDWNNHIEQKLYICFDYYEEVLFINSCLYLKDLFNIYFDSEETAKLAIETFHDELIWYFTEYKDSL